MSRFLELAARSDHLLYRILQHPHDFVHKLTGLGSRTMGTALVNVSCLFAACNAAAYFARRDYFMGTYAIIAGCAWFACRTWLIHKFEEYEDWAENGESDAMSLDLRSHLRLMIYRPMFFLILLTNLPNYAFEFKLTYFFNDLKVSSGVLGAYFGFYGMKKTKSWVRQGVEAGARAAKSLIPEPAPVPALVPVGA